MDVQRCVDMLRERLAAYPVRGGGIKRARNGEPVATDSSQQDRVPWNWVMERFVVLLQQYPTGVTLPIVVGELESQWRQEQKHWARGVGARTTSLDSVLTQASVAATAVLRVTIKETATLSSSRTVVLRVGDGESRVDMDMYVHVKYNVLVNQGVITTGVSLRLTGCRVVENPNLTPRVRLLPSYYVVPVIGDAARMPAATARLRDLAHTSGQRDAACVLVCTVVHISTTQQVRFRTHARKRALYLQDDSVSSPVPLVLRDDQVGVSQLVRKGDVVALLAPVVSLAHEAGSQWALEYADDHTMVCVQPCDSTCEVVATTQGSFSQQPQPTPASQSQQSQALVQVPVDRSGMLDYATYPHCILVRDLRPNMINVRLCGWVSQMRGNSPHNNSKTDRYGVRIVDSERNATDIVVWGATWGSVCKRARVGHVLLFTGLSTTARRETTGRFYVNCGDTPGASSVTDVTLIPALLQSPALVNCAPLADVLQHRMVVCTAVVSDVEWEDEGTNIALCHSPCQRTLCMSRHANTLVSPLRAPPAPTATHAPAPAPAPIPAPVPAGALATPVMVRAEAPFCPFCSTVERAKARREWCYSFPLTIDDGTASVRVVALPSVLRAIVGMSAEDFCRFTPEQQAAYMLGRVGKEFVFVVSRAPGDFASFRLEQCLPAAAATNTHELRALLHTLQQRRQQR